MPRRMISTDISYSEALESCSEWAQLLHTRMVAHQDDWGRMVGAPAKVKAKLKPMSRRGPAQFEKAIVELAEAGLVCWYSVAGVISIALRPDSCEEYQTNVHSKAHERNRASKFPPPPDPRFQWPEDTNPEPSGTILAGSSQPNLTQPNLTEPKTTSRRSAPDPRVKQLQEYYVKRSENHVGAAKVPFPWARAGTHFKEMLGKMEHSEEAIQATIDEFFDNWISDKGGGAFSHYQSQYLALVKAVVEKQR